MGALLLVRHGQASLAADDYDQLSPIGERQCRLLGAWLAAGGQRVDAVYTGRLRRHRQSLAAIADAWPALPAATELAGLDEYDSHALLRAVHPGPLTPPDQPEAVRQHFRLLRGALLAWMQGRLQPEGMLSPVQFEAGVADALTLARRDPGGRVLIVSSGGPISRALGQVLGLPHEAVIDLNMGLRNASLSSFVMTAERLVLESWNTVGHLEAVADGALITRA
ncbi:MAG TPA: histidine phosphatase family protein [Rubrivivax sp.]|jgi:broad specificity phosphatase PhoE|nr:histidine phosphatase family protein [Rubrivivax sp.]